MLCYCAAETGFRIISGGYFEAGHKYYHEICKPPHTRYLFQQIISSLQPEVEIDPSFVQRDNPDLKYGPQNPLLLQEQL